MIPIKYTVNSFKYVIVSSLELARFQTKGVALALDYI